VPGLLFGLDVPTSAGPGADPAAAAQTAEALGFDFISASDHPCGASASHETWTMLSWIAARTSRIRVATRVLGVPYRPPAMVAKMAETLDRLSDGRLILGLGGGASDEEFRAFGLTVPSPRDKVDGLEEAVRIVRGLWSQPRFSFTGRLYHTNAAALEPKPGHHIPIWLGTFGDRALAVTGRVADGWIPSLGLAPPARIPAMRDRIIAAARAVARDPDTITCGYNIEVRIGRDRDAHPGDADLTGSASAVTDRLVSFVRLGFTAFNLKPYGPGRAEQVERLAREVIPAVRSAA
jgi:alkanesulfonate monooxygenase SsuD/methylene tetrahydromethanopterin reductase-like flavin-dependent oxidoreductase (luciferase family)